MESKREAGLIMGASKGSALWQSRKKNLIIILIPVWQKDTLTL